MAGYVQFYKYTQQGLSSLKASPGRLTAAKAEAAKLGIQSVGVWLTMGEYDLVGIWDAPDDQTMAAFSLALGKLGNVSATTARAFSEDEFAKIVSKLP